VTGPVVSLNTVWFALIGLLWAGYFLLEGFDFGVGILSPVLSADDVDRRVTLNTIGPFWDGNEVWLIVAGGATFAAFPTWYATMFSSFYLPLFVILFALILRGVAFEFRSKGAGRSWRRSWGAAHLFGSAAPAVLWGVAFTDLVRGLAIGPGAAYRAGLGGLVSPVALLGGLTTLVLFSLHGAVFLSLKTTGDLRRRARRAAAWLAAPALACVAGIAVAVGVAVAGTSRPDGLPGVVPVAFAGAAVGSVAAAGLLVIRGREGWAFAATAVSVLTLTGAAFSALFPRVMVSTRGAADSLTIWNAASAHETLLVMTVVAAIFTPVVLAYQGWTYWVFRQRLTRPPAPSGADGSVEPPAPQEPFTRHPTPAPPAR